MRTFVTVGSSRAPGPWKSDRVRANNVKTYLNLSRDWKSPWRTLPFSDTDWSSRIFGSAATTVVWNDRGRTGRGSRGFRVIIRAHAPRQCSVDGYAKIRRRRVGRNRANENLWQTVVVVQKFTTVVRAATVSIELSRAAAKPADFEGFSFFVSLSLRISRYQLRLL